MQALHAALFPLLGTHRNAGDRVHHPQKFLLAPGGQEIQQRCGQHVARSAHIAFQVQCFHASLAPIWLIMLARYPAPNPLSMFTTLTPLAQELSMDKSADKPLKLAP